VAGSPLPGPVAALDSVPGGVPPVPLPSSGGAAWAAGGFAASTLFALLVSLLAFGLRHFWRSLFVGRAWRVRAFVAVIERPG
jgi:hypothetical protein